MSKVLELPRDLSWLDTIDAQTLHALTSMVLAFALQAGIPGDDLPDLMLAALEVQKDLDGAAGIDEGVLAVLDRLGFKW